MSKSATAVKQDNRLVRYLKETRAEMRKVHWPSRKEARNLTTIVVAVTVFMTILLGTLDFIFTWLAEGVFVASDPVRTFILIGLGVIGLIGLYIALRRQ